ncbi:MAG: squalene/phytoene synthase family protein, partial [Verrucomicrobiota bacterium]
SRSIYLTIKMLPKSLRSPVGLGYLLARASDTIADTRGPSPMIRKSLLVRYRGLVHVENPSDVEVDLLTQEIREDILPKVHHDGEQVLLQRLGECFEWLRKFQGPDRSAINKVLDLVVKAQINDVEVFGSANRMSLQFIQSDTDLVRYCDMVAGSVGVFWTDLCANRDEHFAEGTVEAMRVRGEAYGRGLQLLNIVQDLGDDLKLGRCYLPQQQLLEAGWQDGPWTTNQGAIMDVSKMWLDRSEKELREGLGYVQRMKNRRLKVATVLPALLGARTICDIRKSQSAFLKNRVKIPRPEVKRIVTKATMRGFMGGNFEALFDELISPPRDLATDQPGQHLS